MYWWMRVDWWGHLEPAPVPPIGYTLEQLTDPAFVPNFSKHRFEFWRDESVGEEILDFAHYGSSALYVREGAYKKLEDIFLQISKPTRIICEDYIYYFIKIDMELELFDYEASTFSRWGMYEKIEDEVDTITRVIIKPPPPNTPDMFRLSGRPEVRKNIIVSDRFKRLYEENGFTGLYFRRADLPLN